MHAEPQPSPLGQRLETLLTRSGLSQREAERLAGVGQGTIRLLVKGWNTNPQSRTVSKLATLFGSSTDWLSDGRGRPPTKQKIAVAVTKARTSGAAS